MLKKWGITEEQLYKDTVSNMKKKYPVYLNTWGAFSKAVGNPVPSAPDVPSMPMYVLSNNRTSYGTTVILYKNNLEVLWMTFGNYYLIPASKHMFIVLPEGVMNLQEAKAMLKFLNASSPEEKLTDSIYFYDGKSLQIAE